MFTSDFQDYDSDVPFEGHLDDLYDPEIHRNQELHDQHLEDALHAATPEDFSFQVESVHPFFSDEGTASVPVTLPASSENLDLLGHPENIHNSKRHIRIYEAFLQSGIFQKRCRLISESAGVKAGITASIALQESEMYADLQDRTLRDIFAAKAFVATRTFPADATGIYNGEFRNMDYLYDVALFPVASDKDSDGNVSIINQPLNGSINDEARTVTVNGKTISARMSSRKIRCLKR